MEYTTQAGTPRKWANDQAASTPKDFDVCENHKHCLRKGDATSVVTSACVSTRVSTDQPPVVQYL